MSVWVFWIYIFLKSYYVIFILHDILICKCFSFFVTLLMCHLSHHHSCIHLWLKPRFARQKTVNITCILNYLVITGVLFRLYDACACTIHSVFSIFSFRYWKKKKYWDKYRGQYEPCDFFFVCYLNWLPQPNENFTYFRIIFFSSFTF